MFALLESASSAPLLPLALALAGCSPSSQDAALHDPRTPPAIADADRQAPSSAAMGPTLEAASAAENPAPALTDTPAEAAGRRTLSTAFVRVGPDGLLTVKRHDGRVMVLTRVTIGPRKYCGTRPGADGSYCGRYSEVAAAWPGDASTLTP